MFRIAICDDENYFLLHEREIITSYMEMNEYDYIIDSFESGKALLERNEELSRYDIIFLDIDMRDLYGLETARRIREISDTVYLVFVTTFLMCAVEGYKVNAVRCILKDGKSFRFAMMECLDTIIKEINRVQRRYCFEFLEGRCEVKLEDIVYVESSLHKLIFYINGMKQQIYSMYEKLDVIESVLEGKEFCRIHKSFLVNMRYVNKVTRYQLELYDGTVLNIAKGKYVESNQRFLIYQEGIT